MVNINSQQIIAYEVINAIQDSIKAYKEKELNESYEVLTSLYSELEEMKKGKINWIRKFVHRILIAID